MRIARQYKCIIKRVARKPVSVIYEGLILVDRRERRDQHEFLCSLGITPGAYSPFAGGYEGCIVPLVALDKLDPYWGTFYWSLFPRSIQ